MAEPHAPALADAGGRTLGVSVLIPARDEEASVAGVVGQVRAALERLPPGTPSEVLVVDDGSTDQTAARARAAGARVVARTGRGYGAALKHGVRETAHEVIVILDADGSYPAEAIPELVALVHAGAEQVVGVRPPGAAAVPPLRRGVKRLVTSLASALTRHRVRDLNSGMRAFRRTRIEPFLRSMPDGFSFTTTLTVAALLDAWEVRWLPVDYRERTGRSKFRPFSDTARLLLSLVRAVVYFDPLKLFGPVATALALAGAAFAGYDVIIERNLTDKTVLMSLSAIEVFVLGLLADLIVRRH